MNYKQHSRYSYKHSMVTLTPILEYYRGFGTDQSNRTVRDIWNFSFKKLENIHDYIQWLFPTSQRSVFNVNAPVLTIFDKLEFLNRVVYRKNLNKSLEVMLNFYGLERHYLNNKIIISRNPVTFE